MEQLSQTIAGLNQAVTTAAGDAAKAQLGIGKGANAGIDKPIRNIGSYQKSDEYDKTGSSDTSKQRIEGDLDI